ncbi:MAG: FHA domain-containing protein, partial [Clostridia bacterium]|nr:FHA domain-containing protein [Clostridia bacterium]
MLVSLITKSRYQTLQLPEWKDGHFLITDPNSGEELFDIVGNGDSWLLKSCGDNQLLDNVGDVLADGQLIRVRIGEAMEKALLYVEKSGRQYAKYARCPLGDNVSFMIGADKSADIQLDSPVISPNHCILSCRNRKWSVQALDNKLGVYVNGVRTSQANLAPGDTVSVMNQKFIVLPGLLVLNAQNVMREALHGKLTPLHFTPVDPEKIVGKKSAPDFFHREPRFTNGLFEKDINVIAPPSPVGQPGRDSSAGQKDDSDALLTYGPAVTSGLMMLLGGLANPITGLGMLASSLVWPAMRRKKQREAEQLKRQEYQQMLEEEAREEEKRRQLYSQYLARLDQELDELNRKQAQQLLKFNPRVDQEADKL